MELYRVAGSLVCFDSAGDAWQPPETGNAWRFGDVARAATDAGSTIPEFVRTRFDPWDGERPASSSLETPVDSGEVWAAGVTYEISEEARKGESALPEVYRNVYAADRPELFFKATPQRTVPPGEAVGIRGDSDWDVPEPELGIVLFEGQIVGFTVGNDVSSRDLEGQNPLYLPQAKVYDRCCALGPCVTTPDAVGDPLDLTMELQIRRDDAVVYQESTSTAEMVRTPSELVDWLTRHDATPDLVVLLTGTSLVPPDEFTLSVDDVVRIDVEGIGTLRNPVVEV